MSVKHYNVVIVGSGPAGLGVGNILKDDKVLASRTLILEKGNSIEKRICDIREGKKCKKCTPCSVISGIGGAGPFTDGKICLYSQDLKDLFPQKNGNGDEEDQDIDIKINDYLNRVKNIWLKYGVSDFKEIKINNNMELLKAEAFKHNIDFICYDVLHIGSDGAKKIINTYIKDLLKSGITLETNANVINIDINNDNFLITYEKSTDSKIEKNTISSDFLVLALGREIQKTYYIKNLFKNFKLSFKPNNLEIGCRIEIPYQIMEDIIKITFDPKFKMTTPTYQDTIRTFCTCHRGKIVREGICVNGHVDRSKLTNNTNFALLVKYKLDMELEDAMDYGNLIAKLTIAQGRGRPLIQRLGDLKRGVPSDYESIKKSYIKPTLSRNWLVTPGDITNCYPTRITKDILEGLEMLDNVIKGVNNDHNLIYAPEIKPTCSIKLKDGVKTDVSNLYVCGDFSGYTRGIAQAMVMGMMVGEDIQKEARGLQLKII